MNKAASDMMSILP